MALLFLLGVLLVSSALALQILAVAVPGFFALLADAWTQPTEAKLAPLAQAARQVEGVFRLCYLNTLGRFKGHDQAALKTLDFIRSKEEDDLRAVLNALGGIGAPKRVTNASGSISRARA